MRAAQFKILTRILEEVQIPSYVYAFEKNKSIPVMAALHTNKEVIVSVDIKDFFHSIKQTRLYELFMRMGISDKPARTMSELCTYKSFVPQGALTSPKVANIVTSSTFGPVLESYCRSKGLTLTIYADDVTISSTNPAENVSEILSVITGAIREAGFRVNNQKTKVMWKTSRQYVCGVVVNSKTNMIRKERMKLKAIVHNITRNGLDVEAVKTQSEPGTFASHIKGRLNWLSQLNKPLGDKFSKELDEYLKATPISTITRSQPITEGAIQANATEEELGPVF